MVTTAGKPFGHGSDGQTDGSENMNDSSSPRSSPSPKMIATSTRVMMASLTPSWSSRCCSGRRFRLDGLNSGRYPWPSSVWLPVSVTTAKPRP
jgi:hypothetical protein